MPNLTFSGPPMNLTIRPDNPQWILIYFRVFGVISFLINMLSLYCILKKSSKEMATYKWFLFNIWFWSFLMDAGVMYSMHPVSWFPLFGGAPSIKFFKHWGKNANYAGFVVAGGVLTNCTMSLVAGFFYRWQVLLPDSTWLETPRRTIAIVIAIHMSYLTPGAVLMWLVRPSLYSDEFIRYHVINADELLEYSYLVFHRDICQNSWVAVVAYSLGISGVLVVGLAMLLDSYRRLFLMKDTLFSAQTKNMHKQMLISLMMQAVIPMASYVTPMCLACLMILLEFETKNMQEQTTVMIAVFCTHSTASCLVLLLTVKCYRAALLEIFRLEKFFNRPNVIEVSRSADHDSMI